jgi:hypothetical protein
VASAIVNTAQQVGGSLGTALLNTIAASATAGFVATHPLGQVGAALIHGYSVAMEWGTVILVLGAVAAGALISLGRPAPHGVGSSARIMEAKR